MLFDQTFEAQKRFDPLLSPFHHQSILYNSSSLPPKESSATSHVMARTKRTEGSQPSVPNAKWSPADDQLMVEFLLDEKR